MKMTKARLQASALGERAAALFLMGFMFTAWAMASILCPRFAVGDDLADGFLDPPESAKPWCYWYWISDNISKEGISRDLEAMARVGIGEAFIGNIFLDAVPPGDVKVLSDPWWGMVEHAISEADRVGVDIGMFNCPGWSQSGGPWVEPHEAMRYLVSSETRIQGPVHFVDKLPMPATPFEDVAVLAFPAPSYDADRLSSHAPDITCTPAVANVGRLIDGDQGTAVAFSPHQPLVIEFELDQPLTARHLSLTPSTSDWAAQGELLAADGDGAFQLIASFRFDRSNMAVSVGPMPRGPVLVSCAATTARKFRLVLRDLQGQPALAELNLSAAARLNAYVEKQLGKMHPTPLPMWDAYLWPTSQEPEARNLSLRLADVQNLTDRLAPDGTLQWDAPEGEWVVQRVGMTPTGTRNSPASPEAEGLEVDKMNRRAAAAHFGAFIGRLLQRIPAADRRAFKRVVADSYEMGSQNWTDDFADVFRERYRYDPMPWLAVLQGRIVGSAEQSDRFLWDLRRLVADRIATEYVGGLRDLCRPYGLELWLENYGHWGFPSEFLRYGSQSDRIGGEFWMDSTLGSIECRAASSCANTYGKPFVSAEAFTGGPPFRNTPSALKVRGDWAFCEGVNHFVLHVNIHQPWEDRRPGVNAPFGTEFNRHNTWFESSQAWIDYIRRCCWMLQQGTRVADVAYFIGEDTPKMTGIRDPALPAGHDFDYINAEVIEQQLTVEDGRLRLPHGTTYRVLVLPPQATMRPSLLRKIRDLVARGATVIGPLPSRSPSMEDYPRCDAEVQQLANALRTGERRVRADADLSAVFASLNLGPDFDSGVPLRFTHRRSGDTDIYFVANPEDRPVSTVASFRVGGKAPELWRPDTGGMEQAAVYDVGDDVVRLPLQVGPQGSIFVVFRQQAAALRIVSVQRNGQPLLSTDITSSAAPPVAIELSRATDGRTKALVWQPGNYTLTTSDGSARTLHVPKIPDPVEITGPWVVAFQSLRGGPEPVTLETLTDWTQNADPAVKYYSGTATYRRQFKLAPTLANQRLYLDLGDVRDLAVIRLNGKTLGVRWMAPWKIDITAAARSGDNVLEIDIVNPWNNRLVGDAKLPPERRLHFLAAPTVEKDAPLLPAGLLGPITLSVAEAIEMSDP